MAGAFHFELVSPEAAVLKGEATQVVVPGTEGYFTVLANHAPFMSTVKPGVVEVQMEGEAVRKIFVRGGFADVSPSGFTLLAEQAMALEDFDEESLEQQIRDAHEDVTDAKDDTTRERATLALAQLEESRAAILIARNPSS